MSETLTYAVRKMRAWPSSLLLSVPNSEVRSVRSAGTILDDIGNMFDDLADQLDAMLD